MRHDDPNDPARERLLLSIPTARAGDGVHADEADGALPDIARKLTRATVARIAREGDVRPYLDPAPPLPRLVPAASLVRRNPGGDDDGEDEDAARRAAATGEKLGSADATVAQRELFPIAKLVTGNWGTVDAPELLARAASVDGVRVDTRGFFVRIADCKERIDALRRAAEGRYTARDARPAKPARAGAAPSKPAPTKKTGTAARPWLSALDKMSAACAYVLARRGKTGASVFPTESAPPFGLEWGVVAAKGNQKLPFASYSELPMATCPGAGSCAVYPDEKLKGWCYSFKAFRYPDAFARQFLNTLANYADREFAGLGGRDRAVAAPPGAALARREWPAFVLGLAWAKTRPQRAAGKPAFLRLFVDGDVGPADALAAWMAAVESARPGGEWHESQRKLLRVARTEPDPSAARARVRALEVYGYSKAWPQFVLADHWIRRGELGARLRAWPENYVLNLSSGSVYHRHADIRTAAEQLPVARGYFEAVDLRGYIRDLDDPRRDPNARFEVAPAGRTPFAFSEGRIRDFLALNRAMRPGRRDESTGALVEVVRADGTVAPGVLGAIRAVLPGFEPPKLPKRPKDPERRPGETPEERAQAVERVRQARAKIKPAETLRRAVYRAWLAAQIGDTAFGATVRRELARDAGYAGEDAEAEYLKKLGDRAARRVAKELAAPGGRKLSAAERAAAVRAAVDAATAKGFTEKAMHDKALALVLHEAYWTAGLGGSCPLICGNCTDAVFVAPGVPQEPGVHRCASKGIFRGQTIHIGRH
jgi:hypothetical protein